MRKHTPQIALKEQTNLITLVVYTFLNSFKFEWKVGDMGVLILVTLHPLQDPGSIIDGAGIIRKFKLAIKPRLKEKWYRVAFNPCVSNTVVGGLKSPTSQAGQ